MKHSYLQVLDLFEPHHVTNPDLHEDMMVRMKNAQGTLSETSFSQKIKTMKMKSGHCMKRFPVHIQLCLLENSSCTYSWLFCRQVPRKHVSTYYHHSTINYCFWYHLTLYSIAGLPSMQVFPMMIFSLTSQRFSGWKIRSVHFCWHLWFTGKVQNFWLFAVI